MTVTQRRGDEIQRYRRVYFSSNDGKRVLYDMLEAHGLFADKSEFEEMMKDPGPSLALMIQGLALLQVLGVLEGDNIGRLIDAMTALPIPDIMENE